MSGSAAASADGGVSSFLGALISIISHTGVRYQGILADINAEQATIRVEKVKSWGTEGRIVQQGRPQNEELPASDTVYDQIVFRAADVKDLKIDDPKPVNSRPVPSPAHAPQQYGQVS